VTDLVPAGEVVVDAELVAAEDGADLGALIEQWITAKAKSEHTERAYRTDIAEWFSWCAGHGVDPMLARKTDVERWHRGLAETPGRRTGRTPSRATLARKVSTVASYYEFCVDEDYLEAVPVRSSTRPRAEKHSTTVGLSPEETVLLQKQAAESGARDTAVIVVLLILGLRVAELAALTVGSYRWQRGHRVLRVVGKGGKTRELVVDGDAKTALEAWLKVLADKAGLTGVSQLQPDARLFPNLVGGPLSQQAVMRTVQRLAKAAGIASWPKLSPHSLRHTCATNMLDAGVPINVVQEQLGHEDVSTTMRYDRARGSIDRKVKGTGDYQAFLNSIRDSMGAAA
jgi:integrase/recombinase XerD